MGVIEDKREIALEEILIVRETATELKVRLHEENCTELDEMIAEKVEEIIGSKIWTYLED